MNIFYKIKISSRYTPQKIDIDFKLQPFVPEYVPAVGDIDAFLKVTTPACDVRGGQLAEQVLEHIDNLGKFMMRSKIDGRVVQIGTFVLEY